MDLGIFIGWRKLFDVERVEQIVKFPDGKIRYLSWGSNSLVKIGARCSSRAEQNVC